MICTALKPHSTERSQDKITKLENRIDVCEVVNRGGVLTIGGALAGFLAFAATGFAFATAAFALAAAGFPFVAAGFGFTAADLVGAVFFARLAGNTTVGSASPSAGLLELCASFLGSSPMMAPFPLLRVIRAGTACRYIHELSLK
jgi:hypothetical protein